MSWMKTYVVVFGLILYSAHPVGAEDIPWSYNGTGAMIVNTNNSAGSSTIQFSGTAGFASGDSGFIPFVISTDSTASLLAPDSFTKATYGLELTLGDTMSLASMGTTSGTVKFLGSFSASKISRENFLSPVNEWLASPVQAVILGSDATGWRKYTVELLSFTPPGKPGVGFGSIYGEVHITGVDIGDIEDSGPTDGAPPPTANTPEPNSLILAGIGLPILCLFWRAARGSRKRLMH